MEIVDLNNEKLNACFRFFVGNCEISVSTVFNKDRAEIAIFDKDNGELLSDKLLNLSSAISWVNDFGRRD